MSSFSCLVSRPFFDDVLDLSGILSIKILKNSLGISLIQINLIASIKAGIFEECFLVTLFLKAVQNF